MQERGDRHAAFWACPPCDCAFPSSSEFAEHLYTYHEEAVYADEAAGIYLTCSHCGQEVGRFHFQAALMHED
jgi:phage terminase large subunit GpA-like protein